MRLDRGMDATANSLITVFDYVLGPADQPAAPG